MEKREQWISEIKKTDRVLDIGCWSGNRIERLNNKCNIVGLEIDPQKIKLSSKKIISQIYQGDICSNKIPFKEHSFDLIFLEDVLEHLKSEEKAMKNISNLIKKDGRLIITVPRSIKFLEFWDPAWIKGEILRENKHKHYTKKEIFNLLKKHNLKIEEYYIRGSPGWLFFRWFNLFLRYGLKIKYQKIHKAREGYFTWTILVRKI